MILICCLITTVVFHGAASSQQTDNQLVLRIDPTPEYPRNSEGSFVSLEDGTILYAYTQFYGGTDDHSQARIVKIESIDDGLTWSESSLLVENTGEQNVMSASLLRLKSGNIALFYLIKNSLHDLKPYMHVSTDETETWSEPYSMITAPGYFVMNNDRVIQLKEGRLIAPVAFHRPIYHNENISADWRGIAMWYLSDDEGKTWYESTNWWGLPVPDVARSGLQEPGVVELSDGSIFSWSRTIVGAQYGFRSNDEGETFSAPEPTNLVSPLSPASIKRIPGTPDLLAVYNDHSGRFPFAAKRRNPLVVAISQDGGQTWPIAKMIESDLDGHYCYTAIHFIDDYVLLGYCAGFLSQKDMYGLNPHRIRRVKIEWLYKQ